MKALNLPDVEIATAQQLSVEMSADWSGRRLVVVIDAAVGIQQLSLAAAPRPGPRTVTPQSQEVSPQLLAELARQLYGDAPDLVVCAVPATSIEFGTTLSAGTAAAVEEAIERIRETICGPAVS